MSHVVQIGAKQILRDGPPFILAEIGVNHDGNLDQGLQLVEAAAAAGCHAVKFQLFRADLLLAKEAGLVDYQKSAASSASELLSNLEMPPEQMTLLVQHAKKHNLAAVVTPFSVELVPHCVAMHVDAIKLASPDLVNRPLLEAACSTNLPLILSTGAAELAEVERTVGWLWKLGAAERTVLLHCVSSYPTPPDHAALAAIAVLRNRFPEMPIGYSDHTTETLTAALAVAAGAVLLEKHLTLNKKSPGPDHAASLEPHEMTQYAALAKTAFAMRGPYQKKPQLIELAVRHQTRQSIVALQNLPAGTVLTSDMLTVKRPGTGIPAADLDQILGKILLRQVPANSLLHWPDVRSEETP